MNCIWLQGANTSTLANVTSVYSAAAVYKLAYKPTWRLTDLVLAGQTLVANPEGRSLRTVELTIVRIAEPACSVQVSHLHEE